MDNFTVWFTQDFLYKPIWMWFIFISVVLFLLVLDLGVFHRNSREIEVKESILMSSFYIGTGLLFGGWVWWTLGSSKAIEYFTGFVVEKTLAMDNIFVIAMIFAYFKIPRLYQHRVLFWGILGVILLRGIIISFGVALVHNFEWVLYIFSLFLVFTGVKMLIGNQHKQEISENFILNLMQKNFRITDRLYGHHFFIRKKIDKFSKPVWHITPLFVALIMIEIADVIFAVDSIPAIFAITTDPYIVYTSNIFAIIGLRALYFALAAMLNKFIYLEYALSIVLIFIGTKIFVVDIFNLEKFPPMLALTITLGILGIGILLSLIKNKQKINS
jgi:tellurite resistance protein TerC